jgi:23S rRNA pseudouridine1911/1915/1917 synthase
VKSRVVRIEVNGKDAKLSRKIAGRDRISVYYTDPPPLDLVPEERDLDILYEDRGVLVINKPQGLVVHPGCGNFTGTLANALVHYCGSLAGEFGGEPLRPGIVHRLDKDTSGVIIVAKNPVIHEFLSSCFKSRTTEKVYAAIVAGAPARAEGVIRTRLARDTRDRKKFAVSGMTGKQAVTRYRVEASAGGYSLVRLMPKTGRTHQLRVHMAHLGCPILGDPIYGKKDQGFPQATLMLHAYSLAIPVTPGGEAKTFLAPLPERFTDILGKLGIGEETVRSLFP